MMVVNPNSLLNLDKGREARFKGAVRVNVSLKPSTHERLKKLPLNVSASIDRIVEWVAVTGKVAEIFLGESPNIQSTHDGSELTEPDTNIETTHDGIDKAQYKADINNTHNRIQELEIENQALRVELEAIKSERGYLADLKRIQQQTELEERNRELQLKRGEERKAKVEAQTELERLRRDYAIAKSQLHETRVELEEARSHSTQSADPAYDADVIALRKELKAEIQRFKDTENSLRGSDVSWQMRVTALTDEVKEVEAKLLRQNDANRKLERELAEVRSQLPTQTVPQDSTILEFPDTTNYSTLGIRELKVLAKAAKIPYYGTLTKAELIEKLTKK